MESITTQPKNTKSAKGTKSAKKILSVMDNKSTALNNEDRNARVAVSAYYKAQARGFKPGNELADWLAAEAEANQ
ncbi:MAG: DUF2934 domain-containing protein [Betaproteobacteria bacterium]|nr:DUF2934 domain-containing protein [Betaproteobacteria bacterium]